MTKKWIAINLLLLATAGFLGWRLRLAIDQFKAENNLAKIQPPPDLKKKMLQEKQAPQVIPVKAYNPAEYSIIPEKNIFSDSRTKEEKVENVAPPEAAPLVQKPILVGIVITDTDRQVSIIDPTAQQQGQTRKAQYRKIGDVYQGYTITQILPDRFVLESGTRKEVIPLREGSKRAQGGKTPILSTRVVPFGGGGITGGTPVGVSGGISVGIPGRTSSVTPIGSTSPVVVGGAAQTTAPSRTVGQPTQQGIAVQQGLSAQPAAQPASQQASPAGESGPTRVIRTPFGDIVRPAR